MTCILPNRRNDDWPVHAFITIYVLGDHRKAGREELWGKISTFEFFDMTLGETILTEQ